MEVRAAGDKSTWTKSILLTRRKCERELAGRVAPDRSPNRYLIGVGTFSDIRGTETDEGEGETGTESGADIVLKGGMTAANPGGGTEKLTRCKGTNAWFDA